MKAFKMSHQTKIAFGVLVLLNCVLAVALLMFHKLYPYPTMAPNATCLQESIYVGEYWSERLQDEGRCQDSLRAYDRAREDVRSSGIYTIALLVYLIVVPPLTLLSRRKFKAKPSPMPWTPKEANDTLMALLCMMIIYTLFTLASMNTKFLIFEEAHKLLQRCIKNHCAPNMHVHKNIVPFAISHLDQPLPSRSNPPATLLQGGFKLSNVQGGTLELTPNTFNLKPGQHVIPQAALACAAGSKGITATVNLTSNDPTKTKTSFSIKLGCTAPSTTAQQKKLLEAKLKQLETIPQEPFAYLTVKELNSLLQLSYGRNVTKSNTTLLEIDASKKSILSKSTNTTKEAPALELELSLDANNQNTPEDQTIQLLTTHVILQQGQTFTPGIKCFMDKYAEIQVFYADLTIRQVGSNKQKMVKLEVLCEQAPTAEPEPVHTTVPAPTRKEPIAEVKPQPKPKVVTNSNLAASHLSINNFGRIVLIQNSVFQSELPKSIIVRDTNSMATSSFGTPPRKLEQSPLEVALEVLNARGGTLEIDPTTATIQVGEMLSFDFWPGCKTTGQIITATLRVLSNDPLNKKVSIPVRVECPKALPAPSPVEQ